VKAIVQTTLLLLLATAVIQSCVCGGAFPHQAFNASTPAALTVVVRIYGNITNLGDRPIYVNETDALIFEYPLNTSDQRVLRVRAWVNGVEYSYTVTPSSDSGFTLVINAPEAGSVLRPHEAIDAGVEYVVEVDRVKRLEAIADFLEARDPLDLLPKAGGWDDLKPQANETTTGLTKLWNYTHPLIKLLSRYLSEVERSDKPLAYLLSALKWIDSSIVYSTRIPPRYPWEVVVEGAGDCDDQSNLLITLLRSVGIPSFLETGYVYVGEGFRVSGVAASGLFTYLFIGGGGHGWVAAYIPPWGWIRVDPVASTIDPVTNLKIPLYIAAVKAAYYYWFPTVVTQRVYRLDYAEESAKAIEQIESSKLKYVVVVEMKLLSTSTVSR